MKEEVRRSLLGSVVTDIEDSADCTTFYLEDKASKFFAVEVKSGEVNVRSLEEKPHLELYEVSSADEITLQGFTACGIEEYSPDAAPTETGILIRFINKSTDEKAALCMESDGTFFFGRSGND